jgi:hypothetical protein
MVLLMSSWGYLGSGWLLAILAAIAVVFGLAAGRDSGDAMWLFVGIGAVLGVAALPLMIVGAVAQGTRLRKSTSAD